MQSFLNYTSFNKHSTSNRQQSKRHYRTVWISDVHLGTKGSNAESLLAFLRVVECETLYLVGDIVDGWRLKRVWYWPQSHNDVVQKLLRRARKGSRIIYIPGNHDEFLADYVKNNFGGIEILEHDIHLTADDRRVLVLHGHEFDSVIRYSKWLAFVGDHAYQLALNLNYVFNLTRKYFGRDYWSLSSFLKSKVKNAVNYISSFEQTVVLAAKNHQVDAVICGHIHHPQIRQIGDVEYYNDGDWVESCTALVEDWHGEIHLINWFDEQALPDDKASASRFKSAAYEQN